MTYPGGKRAPAETPARDLAGHIDRLPAETAVEL